MNSRRLIFPPRLGGGIVAISSCGLEGVYVRFGSKADIQDLKPLPLIEIGRYRFAMHTAL
jgi:hypothetical protein